jgi:hypothetical protein
LPPRRILSHLRFRVMATQSKERFVRGLCRSSSERRLTSWRAH